MSNDIYVIGDTHFGHRAIINFEKANRPFATIEEHDEALVEAWNSVVKKKDSVYHLGDVLFGEGSFQLLYRLNGLKKLVMGNHDRYPSEKYLRHFSKLLGSAEVDGCILTHIPVHPCQFPRYRLNIHGHSQSKALDDPRYVCVSAEQTGLKPVPLRQLIGSICDPLGHFLQTDTPTDTK